MPIARRTPFLLTLAAAFLVAGGCGLAYRPYYDEGGSGASIDEFTYVSRPHSPKTVTLVDTRTGETLWTTDVPVGKQLVIRFYKDEAPDNAYTPDMMRWGVFEAGQRWGRKGNEMLVPPTHSRRIDLDVRPEPEFAVREQPAGEPAYIPPPAQPARATSPQPASEPVEFTPRQDEPPAPVEPMIDEPASEPADLPPGVREIRPSGGGPG